MAPEPQPFVERISPEAAAKQTARRVALAGASGVLKLVGGPSEVTAFGEALRRQGIRPRTLSIADLDGAAPAGDAQVSIVELGKDDVPLAARLNAARGLIAAEQVLVLAFPSLEALEALALPTADLGAWSVATWVLARAGIDRTTMLREYVERVLPTWRALDLRGLVQAEGAERPLELLSVYQALRARKGPDFPLGSDGGGLARELAGARTAFVGGPGSGKTTLLRVEAIRAGEDFLAGRSNQVPFFDPVVASARRAGGLGEGIAARAAALSGLPIEEAVIDALRSGDARVFLDGLDESPSREDRRIVAQAVEELSAACPSTAIWVSSRATGYTDAPLRGFEVLTLDGFSRRDTERFVRAWFAEVTTSHGQSAATADEQTRALLSQIEASDRLKELATTPLLLTLIAVASRAAARLPDRRIELYEHIARVLLERWNDLRSIEPREDAARMSMSDAVRILGPLATWMMEHCPNGIAARADAERRVLEALGTDRQDTAPSLARRLLSVAADQVGLLSAIGPDQVQFTHRTFAEYFAARQLVRSNASLLERLKDPRWVFAPEHTEVVLLCAAQIGIVAVDDERLDAFVGTVLDAESRAESSLTVGVSAVLTGLLCEHPQLRSERRDALADALLRRWFGEQHTPEEWGRVGWHILRGRSSARDALDHAVRVASTKGSVAAWFQAEADETACGFRLLFLILLGSSDEAVARATEGMIGARPDGLHVVRLLGLQTALSLVLEGKSIAIRTLGERGVNPLLVAAMARLTAHGLRVCAAALDAEGRVVPQDQTPVLVGAGPVTRVERLPELPGFFVIEAGPPVADEIEVRLGDLKTVVKL